MLNIDCTYLQNMTFGVFKRSFFKNVLAFVLVNSFSIIETAGNIVFVKHTSYICILDIEDLT